VVQLALMTGIAPSVWATEDDRVIETAWALLDEQAERIRDRR